MAILTKIRSSNIADSAITTTKIAVDAVTAGKIVAGAVAADVGTGGITTALIAADAVTSAKIAPDITLTGGAVRVPVVATVDLPGTAEGANASQTAANGMLLYNSTTDVLQQRVDGVWSNIANVVPIITGFQYSDGATATAEKTVAVTLVCGTTLNGTTVTAASTTGMIEGQVVSGPGIALGSTVVSIIASTSFVLSIAATATSSPTVTLTFGGVITITGSNFDSILAGNIENPSVTFGGTSATAISVNATKTIITCTPPAHAAAIVLLKVTNADGLSAETNFTYDIEPIFTTAAGTLGAFVIGTDLTGTPGSNFPRMQGTEDGSASGVTFERVTSASDITTDTSAVGASGLTVQSTGYLTGTVAGVNATTYPFYAVAIDNENQKTAPRLFNITSWTTRAVGGLETTLGIYKIHTFKSSSTFVINPGLTMDYLMIAGGGGGGARMGGGGGAGGVRYGTSFSLPGSTTYTVTVGAGGSGASGTLFTTQGETYAGNAVMRTITDQQSNYSAGDSISGMGIVPGTTVVSSGSGTHGALTVTLSLAVGASGTGIGTVAFGGVHSNGGNSVLSGSGITTITADGGGSGGWQGQLNAGDGGSGAGGNGEAQVTAQYRTKGDGINDSGTFGSATWQGYDGGTGGAAHAGGGGGGAGAVGVDGVGPNTPGPGGDGISTFWGLDAANSTLVLANAGGGIGELLISTRWIGGGGGGALHSGSTLAAGGKGGGGDGEVDDTSSDPTAGAANTGGGGGGINTENAALSSVSEGGSGVVIIRVHP